MSTTPGPSRLNSTSFMMTNGKRVDIEEAKNLAAAMPDKVKEMDDKLTAALTEMKASYPYYNPNHPKGLPKSGTRSARCFPTSARATPLASRIRKTELKYCVPICSTTMNGGDKSEEWFRIPAELGTGKGRGDTNANTVTATAARGHDALPDQPDRRKQLPTQLPGGDHESKTVRIILRQAIGAYRRSGYSPLALLADARRPLRMARLHFSLKLVVRSDGS